MSVATIAALSALACSLIARRRRRRATLGLDDVVIALVLHAALVAAVATSLAFVGWFGRVGLSVGCGVVAVLVWPWAMTRERDPPVERPTGLVATLVLLAIVAGGVVLRTPTIPAALAGRDQGTYVLRARQSLRTGTLGWTDEVIAAAGRELESGAAAPGTYDILGLYPRSAASDEDWRRDHYDAAYRPGAYFGDREAGEVVPQFFHFHPMMLAATGAALGPGRVEVAVTWIAGLWLLCLACCARRLWPRGPWAALAVGLIAVSPLAIWTGRTPLSENPMALLSWTAVLVALRMRDGVERAVPGAWIVAACVGACAGVRGNALVIVPVMLALLWLRARGRERGAGAALLVLGGVWASVAVHAASAYPYVHDELLRRAPALHLGPEALVGIAGIGAAVWLLVDLGLARAPGILGRLQGLSRRAPLVLAVVSVGAVLLWWGLRAAAPSSPPYSRLDPAPVILGLPLSVGAALGLGIVAWRWRPGPKPGQIWLLALASAVPTTLLLYAPRGLPTLALFYYARYLVPELLPVAVFLATAALASVHAWGLARTGERRGSVDALVLAAGLGLSWSVAGPLIVHPQLRLREYVPAADAVDWLAARLPEDAIVIAGGEGWHSGHTHNQVGGALALSHGLEVLPYRTREDAWITAWELLVAGPARRGEVAPPLFLLVNEAAHQYTRDTGERVALLDDQLWSPFVVERASLLELFVHALTPTPEQLPTRVARHELRMALLRVRVEPEALAAIQTHTLDGSADVEVSGGLHDDGRACVSPERALKLVVPRPRWAAHLVVVAEVTSVAMARKLPAWTLTIDGRAVGVEPARGLRPRPRATLGPIPLPLSRAGDPSELLTIELRGAAVPGADGDCAHGRVAALRLLPRERSGTLALAPEQLEAVTLAPEQTLGHPIEPTIWVPGRSLSRHRPGIEPTPKLSGLAMILPAGASSTFPPTDLPVDADGRPLPLDVVVTLTRTTTSDSAARLHVRSTSEEIGTLTPPPSRARSWVAEPIRWQPQHDRAQLQLELDAPAGTVEVRDIALFTGYP